MNKSFFILISCLLVISLNARENPFEPTDIYKEKQIEFLKQLELEEKQEKQQQEQMQLREQALLQKEKELEDLEYKQQEELRKIEELKAQRAALEKQKQQEIEQMEKMKEQKLLEIKKAKMAQKNKYNVLPFVHIEANDDTLVLYVDTKFKLINQDILKDRKKILYDFRGHTSFYTIKKNLNSQAFKTFTVGTHKKKGFFRVVIEVNDPTSTYSESINTKEGKITLTKK